MTDLLQTHKDVQAVFAANDAMIMGAIAALRAQGIPLSRVVTVGCDAEAEALRAVKEGRLTASIESFPGEQARTALRLLVGKARDGRDPPSKEVNIAPMAIDKANVDKAEKKDPTP